MPYFRRYLTTIGVMLAVAVAVRLLLDIPSWFSLAGLTIAWPILGTLITIDDDLPGGWSNPDGKLVPEWRTLWWWADLLLVRGALVLCLFAVERAFTGRPAALPSVAAIAMLCIGVPIFLRGVRRESPHAV